MEDSAPGQSCRARHRCAVTTGAQHPKATGSSFRWCSPQGLASTLAPLAFPAPAQGLQARRHPVLPVRGLGLRAYQLGSAAVTWLWSAGQAGAAVSGCAWAASAGLQLLTLTFCSQQTPHPDDGQHPQGRVPEGAHERAPGSRGAVTEADMGEGSYRPGPPELRLSHLSVPREQRTLRLAPALPTTHLCATVRLLE